MFLQKQISHFLGSALRRMNLILVLAVFSTSVSAVYTYTRTLTPEHAHAATSSNLNFQARLLSANGNTVPDGYYNIEFNLYSVSAGGSSLWTETRDFDGTDDRVRTVNGYLSVNLGSVNALPNIDWSQDLWLGMTVRGSATCAFATTCTPADSEMTPRTKLTAVPYALAAGNVRSANTAAGSTNSDGVNITTGAASGATSNTGTITLQSGNSTTSGNTGGISLQTGNATSGNSGNITLDVGTASGTTGTISIGTANTSGITIGKVGVLTRVDGNFTIGASAGSGTQFTNNGSTLNATLAVLNDSDGGLLGGTPGSPLTAAQSVDIYTSVTINQTTAGQDISFQNPTSGAAGRIMYVLNIGTQSFTMHSVTIPAGYGQLYIWNGSNWRLAASGGGAAITLQAGYDGGNSISSSNGRDLSFTSNDTAVDANLLFNIATGSTGEFKVQSNGTDVLQIGAAGQLQLDVQGNTGGLLIGTDANLYRSAADTLRTDDSLVVQGVLSTLRGADFSTTPSLDNFNFGVASLVRLTGASTQTITGIANGTDGRILTIVNAAGQTAYINNDSASSSAGNKIYTGTGSNLAIPAASSITLIYDAGASYWRIVGGAATSSSGAGAPFVQGGNSFAADAILGTNDATYKLIFETEGTSKAQITTAGDFEFLAAATLQTNVGNLTIDSAAALNLGTTDATNVSISRTGVATTVNGSLNVSEAGDFAATLAVGTADALTITAAGNLTTSGTISSTNAGGKATLTLTSTAADTGLTIGGDTNLYRSAADTLKTDDALIVGGAVGGASITKFQVQNTSGTAVLNVDTTNGRVGIGTAAPSNALDIQGNVNGLFSSSLRNSNAGSSAATVTWLGNDTSALAGAFFMGSSTYSSFGGNNSLNFVNLLNAPVAVGTNGLIRLTIDGAGDATFTGDLAVNGGDLTTTAGTFNLLNAATTANFGTTAIARTINLGTGAAAQTVNIGSTNTTSSVAISAGSGGITLSGNTSVANNSNFTIGTGAQFTNNSSTLLTAITNSDTATNIDIGSAATTVDIATTINKTQTTAGRVLTLPTPTSATAGRVVYINSVAASTQSFTMYGVVIAPSTSASFIWNGATWVATGGGSGVNTIGAVDTTPTTANGARISGSTLYLQYADATYAGLVSTTAQTFAGNKTFTGSIAGQLGLSVTGAAVNLNASSNFDTNINTGTSTGAVNIGNSAAGAVTLQSGTGNDIVLNAGDTIELQDNTNVTGSFNVSVNADIAGTLAVGTADAVTISAAGLITTADDIAVNGGDLTTTAGTFNLLNAATTVNLGSTAIARAVNVGTGAAAQTVNIGSTNTTSTTNINAGSGGITLSGNTSIANGSNFTIGTGSQFTNNSSTLLTAITNPDTATDTDIGTAAATVDIVTTINKTQTTAGRTLTLPTPTSATAGRIVYVNSVAASTQSFTMYGVVIAPSTSAGFIWNGTAWVATSSGGSGVNTIGAVDTTPTTANGARISGSTLYLQYADATYAGLVSSTTQTFAGNKTFTGSIAGQLGLSVTGAAVNLNASSNFDTNINTGTSTGAVNIGNSAAGAISLQSGSAINIGTNANAQTITIGNATGATAVSVLCGTGTCGFGNNVTDHSTILGSTTGASLTTINGGTGGISLTANTTLSATKSLTVTSGATSLTGLAAGSSTAVSISTGAASNVGLNIQGAASQTGNLLQIQDSTGANLTRIDAGGNQENLGYMNSPWGGFGQYSNLIAASERLDTAIWSRTNVSAPAANTIVAPNGTTTAESLATSSSGGSIGYTTITAPTNNNYTFSVWLKSPSGTQNVDLQIVGSTGGTTTVQTVTAHTTWERFWVTRNTNGLTGFLRVQIYPGTASGTGTVHAWGTQLVLGSTPQVYAMGGNSETAATQGAVINGDALFVASSNSATAFRVQDINNNNVFAIDTSSSTAYAINLGAVGASNMASTVNINTTSGATGTQIVNAGSNAKAANAVNLVSGSTGGINLNVSTNSPTNINTGTSTGAVSIGNSAAGTITLQSGNATANAVTINASNAAGGINIDAGTGGIIADTTGAISLDSAAASNFTVTGSGQSFTLAALGGGAQQLIMQSAGTGANAVRIQASDAAGGIDIDAGTNGVTIDSTGAISLDSTAIASNFGLAANSASNAELTISASNAGAGTAAITLTADETINLNAGTVVGTATTQNLFNTTATTINFGGAATTLNIGPTGSGASSILLSGGSADTGCTVNGANGDLTCSGNITGAATGTAGYFSRSGTTLQPATAGDNIQTTASGTITSAGLLTGQAGLTVTGAAVNLNASSNFDTNINTGTSTGAVNIGNAAAGAIALQSGSTVALTSGTTFGITGGTSVTIASGGASDIILNSADTIELQDNTNVTGVLTTSGNLVVGTGATSNSTLQIIGNTAFPTPTGEGHLFYRQDTDQMYIYTGSRWQADRSTATYIVAASDSINKEKADYVADGTDDQDTINAAINALPASPRGVIYLLEGTYNIDDGADNDNEGVEVDKGNTVLMGAGPATVLRNINSINTNFETVSATSISNITIRDLQIDGNRTNQSAGTQYGIDISGVGSSAGSTAVPGATILNVYVKDVLSTGIRLSATTLNSIVSGVKVINSGVNGIEIGTSSPRNSIVGSQVQGSGDVGVLISSSDNSLTDSLVESSTNKGIYTLAARTTISGNTFRSNGSGSNDAAIYVNNGDGSMVSANNVSAGYVGIDVYGSTGVSVTGNTVSSTTSIGIWAHVGSSRTAISGNSVYLAASEGIAINTADYNSVVGNVVDSSTSHGIHLDSNVDYAIVSGNSVHNSASTGASDGIFIDNSTTNNQITGNKITDTAGTGCAIDFATGTPATNTYLADNTYSGTGAASICNIPSTTIQAGQINSSNVFVIQGTAGVALNDGTVTSTATTFNLLNTTVTTANVLGAGTAISIGAATGTLTINNANTVMAGDAQINGGDLTSTSATVNLFNGANPTAINLGTDANAKTITVGNTTLASALNLRVGTGNFTLDGVTNSTFSVGASTTTGTITIGGTAQTGTITLGSSSGTNTVAIGDGTGATTVNIANNNTGGAVNIGAGFTTGTISIGGTGLQTGTISVGSGTGAQIINLGNGSGAKTINIGGSGANVIGIANTQTAGSVSIGAAMTSGTVNIGGTGAQTGTIDLGVGTGAQAINLGTGGTAAKTVVIGNSSVAGSTTTIQGGSTSGVLVKADGANAFRIQNTAGSVTALTADTSAIPKITIGAATGTLTNRNLEVALVDVTTTIRMGDGTNGVSYNDTATGASGKLRYYGTARNTKKVTLVPEFAGAVLTGDGATNTGTMTSDFCSGTSRLSIPSASNPCAATEEHTYYSWTAQATNDYDIYVRYQIPSDFDGFDSDTSIQMFGWATNTTTDSVQLAMFNAAGTQCGSTTTVNTSNITWQQKDLTGSESTDSACNTTNMAPGSTVLFRIHMTVGTNNNFVRAGAISFTYRSNF